MKAIINTFKLSLILALLTNVKCIQYFNENDIPELDYLDLSVDPCDNFYDFACGNFAKIHPRPSNLDLLDQFTLLENELIQLGQEILSSPKSENDPVALRKAKSAYKGCINVHQFNGLLIPEMLTVEEVGGMPLISSSSNDTQFSWNEIGDLVAQYGIPLIFVYTVSQTSQNESVIVISSDPLSNPTMFTSRHYKTYDEVLEESLEELARHRVSRSTSPAAFDVFLRTLATHLLRQTNTSKTDDEIIVELDDMANFMRQLYAGGLIDDDVLPLDTEVTLGQLQTWTDEQFGGNIDMNWVEYLGRVFQMAGVTITEDIKIYQTDIARIYGTLNLVKQTDPAVLKNFALLRVFLFQAPDSDYATRQAFEDYYNAKNYALYPRWEYCTKKILDVVDTASLSYAVTYAYEKYYYNINKISEAAAMIQNVQNSFKDIVNTSDWMDTVSRDAALKKIENMLVLLGYPDFVENEAELDNFYENFRICEWDNYGNARTIRAFKQAYQFSQLGKSDRFFWGKSTFDPNAYYNRPNNKIVIPISMLNPIFFYGSNPILDYSRLGSIIGHEITHGFDVNGKNYDQDGMLQSWWTDETMRAFTAKTACFEQEYGEYYVPEIGTYVNGAYSLNENLADNGGVKESFKAFQKLVADENIEANGNYTLEQLFFIGYATMWCSDESDKALTTILSSSYPPKRYRAIGSLSNMAEFSEAFNCPVGSKMNPENKCSLWG